MCIRDSTCTCTCTYTYTDPDPDTDTDTDTDTYTYTYTHTYTHAHTSIRTSRLEGRRAGRCILRRRDSRCVVSERHRAGVLGLGSPMHGELARPASPHEVGEGALTAVCPPAGPNLPPAQ